MQKILNVYPVNSEANLYKWPPLYDAGDKFYTEVKYICKNFLEKLGDGISSGFVIDIDYSLSGKFTTESGADKYYSYSDIIRTASSISIINDPVAPDSFSMEFYFSNILGQNAQGSSMSIGVYQLMPHDDGKDFDLIINVTLSTNLYDIKEVINFNHVAKISSNIPMELYTEED